MRGGLDMAGYGGVFTDPSWARMWPTFLININFTAAILFKGSRGNRLEEHVARFRTLVESPDAV